ncbi:hypothetical protein [Bosea sp. 117]|uniref:hypothetical protein n=1 Tax=Bosea sp. 117 TaxID=1125973 RepID=UPI0012DE2104|nr:hypothetical protein [Bosea sp. 117]
MRKLILSAATLGIIGLGGVANAYAQSPYYAERYYGGPRAGVVYEGRNVYGPGVYAAPGYSSPDYIDPRSYRRTPGKYENLVMPGDAAVLNQARANDRSTK